jgi:hypothetical protein
MNQLPGVAPPHAAVLVAGGGAPHGIAPGVVAAAPPQQGHHPLAFAGGLTPQHRSYLEKYSDASSDPFGGNYINLYNEYSVGGANTPLSLRNTIYRDGNTGALLHVLIHVRNLAGALPTDPGLIVAYHRLARHDTRLGQAAMPYDGLGLAFFGDVINGQIPTSVVVPDTLYNQLPVTQVPSAGLLQQLIAADPAAEMFGPFPAGTADVDPVTTRQLIVVPNRYTTPLLCVGMAPKAAYLSISGMIHQDGNEVACAPLLEWLRHTVTRRAPNMPPITCSPPLTTPPFLNPQDQQAFSMYRSGIVHQDLPLLMPGVTHNSAVLIAQGITALTDEQRLARQEASVHCQAKDTPKLPSEHFGVLMERVMRWCHAASEADLPEIYEVLANTKRGKARLVLQTAVENALTDLRYLEDFPLSATLATKILDLKWYANLKDDFSDGVNIFALGSLDEETMMDQRRLNQHADAMADGSAASSLIDIATIQDGKHDVCIPRTFAQLRYCIERSQALWHVLLGPMHPITQQHKYFRDTLVFQEKRLECVVTKDPSQRYIVPALLARVVQLEMNRWIYYQMRSGSPLPITPFTQVFAEIERSRSWEPTFPSTYILQETSKAPPPAEISLAGTSGTVDSTLSGSITPGTNPTTSNASTAAKQGAGGMVRNMEYREATFAPFKELNIKSAIFKETMKERKIQMPTNAKGKYICLPFHIKGFCNANCGARWDHFPHTEEEDTKFVAWCNKHYKRKEEL